MNNRDKAKDTELQDLIAKAKKLKLSKKFIKGLKECRKMIKRRIKIEKKLGLSSHE